MLVALTGGIGSGKSTVAARWVELGATEIDADVLAREVVAKGTAGLRSIVEHFSESVLDEDGSLNRAKLASLVFNDPQKRKILEGIIHPLVQQAAKERTAAAQTEIVVYTIPLLAEVSSPLQFDHVVAVSCPATVRIDRLVATRGMTKEEAAARVAAQLDDSAREALADFVINSDCPLDELLAEADRIYSQFEVGS